MVLFSFYVWNDGFLSRTQTEPPSSNQQKHQMPSLKIQKVPGRSLHFCRGRIDKISAVPPRFTALGRALGRVPSYPRQLTYAHTLQNTLLSHLTAPSAAHLTTCFRPGSQHPGLSVQASLPLLPLQRFVSLVIAYYTPLFLRNQPFCLHFSQLKKS